MEILCNKCEYLSKRPGVKNCIIYKCGYWGLVCRNSLPQYIVKSSIGKACPFFREKKKNSPPEQKLNKDDGLDILA